MTYQLNSEFLEQTLLQKKRNFPGSWEGFVILIRFWRLAIFI